MAEAAAYPAVGEGGLALSLPSIADTAALYFPLPNPSSARGEGLKAIFMSESRSVRRKILNWLYTVEYPS
jgi:hypothetical protein